MMKKSSLLGAASLDIAAARQVFERLIGTGMEAHESEYRGDYYRFEKDGVKLIMQTNFMEDDGEVTEAEHPEVRVLVYLDGEASLVESMTTLIVNELVDFKLLRASSY